MMRTSQATQPEDKIYSVLALGRDLGCGAFM